MFPTHNDFDAVALIKKRNIAQKQSITNPSIQHQQQHQQAMSYVRFHASLAILAHSIVIVIWLFWYYGNNTVPDRIVESGFYEKVTSPRYKYALVASISTGSILLFNLMCECIEYVMKEGFQVIKWQNMISLSDERFMRLMVILAMIIPALVNFFTPDNLNKIVLADLMNLSRTLTIFVQTMLGMTATFDVTLWQRRWKAALSLTYFIGGFLIYLLDVQYYQLSNNVLISSSGAAQSVSLCRRVVAIGSGLAMLMYLMHYYTFIAMKQWKKQSLTLAEGIFVLYSIPVYVASVQYVIIVCGPGHTSYWSTSLSNMVTRELLVVTYVVLASLVPTSLIRRYAVAVQTQNSQAKEAIEAVLTSPVLLPCTASELDHLIQQAEKKHSPLRPFAASLARAAYTCHLACANLQSIADDDISIKLSTDLMHRTVDEPVVGVPPNVNENTNRPHPHDDVGGDEKYFEGDEEEANHTRVPFEFRPERVYPSAAGGGGGGDFRRDNISSFDSDNGGGPMFATGAGAGAAGFDDKNLLAVLMSNRRQVLCSKVSSNPMISCISITPPRASSPDQSLSIDVEVRQRFMDMLGRSMQRRACVACPNSETDDNAEANDATPSPAGNTTHKMAAAAVVVVSNAVMSSAMSKGRGLVPQDDEEKDGRRQER